MGTICAHPIEKDECNQTVDTAKRNFIQVQGVLGENVFVDVILGHYRHLRGDSLLVIVEAKYLHHCDPLKQYSVDVGRSIDTIQNMRKTFYKPTLNKSCPFKKVLVCILPHYRSEEADEYRQVFCNVIRQALEGVKDTAVELTNTCEGVNTLPNQMLLSLLLLQVGLIKTGFKLGLVTSERKMMSLYRFQLMKNEQFHITRRQ